MISESTQIIAMSVVVAFMMVGVFALLHHAWGGGKHSVREDLETPCTNCGDKKEDHFLIFNRSCKLCVCPGFEAKHQE